MDFSAKRLALLAGVGDSEDRHEIVREYAQQLNESAETRQLNEDEEAVRKAVRRTIQKMVSEGAITLQEDSIARELEHLRANIQADHDHLAALVDDIHDDKDEIERAEHHREEMREEVVNEEEDQEAPTPEDLERMRKSLEAAEAEAKRREEEKAKQKASQNESINEADASLRRLQMLAGVQILSEGYTDDNLTEGYSDDELRELCHSKDHNCAVVVDHPEWGRGKPLYESHALPDDEGNVEWYDVQFKHGIEKKVMAEDMTILEMEEHDMSEEDVEEGSCMEEDEHLEEREVMPPTDGGPDPDSMAYEEEDQEEGMIYELEDGTLEMRIGEKRYTMQEMEEELNELDEELREPEEGEMIDTASGQAVKPSTSE